MLSQKHTINRFPQDWEQEGSGQMATKRILVIDDEIKIREMYRQIFYSIGFVVMTACNAIEARSLILRHKYDVVLLDINMAEVDGSTLYEVMRTFHKDIKVVVSSVYSINEQKEKVKDADGYFDKSDDKDALVSIVSSLILGAA
jgi:two-component system response regulator ResD